MRPASHQLVAELDQCACEQIHDGPELSKILEKCIVKAGFGLLSTHMHKYEPFGLTVLSIINESHVVLHTYPEAAHVSVDIFTCSKNLTKPSLLLELLQERLQPQSTQVQYLERGDVLKIYEDNRVTISRSDGIDVSLQVHSRLFKTQSKFQDIEIFNSTQFGKMLVLDRHLQVAESDLQFYNEQLVFGNSFKDLNVLILGGGDGGVASCVIESSPRKVTVVDADTEVSEACQKFFRECCGDVFEDSRVEVCAEDISNFLSGSSSQEKTELYDAIIYDLTLHPESFTSLPRKQYLEEVILGTSKNLRSQGSLLMQCCSEFNVSTKELTQELLEKYFKEITFKYVYIPSFACRWLFASAKLL